MAGNHAGASRWRLKGLVVLAPVVALGMAAFVVSSSGATPESPATGRKVEASPSTAPTSTSTTASLPPAVNEPTPVSATLPEPAPTPPAPAPQQTMIIVCESTVVSDGGIETSSQTVTRVPVGTPIPPGCHIG